MNGACFAFIGRLFNGWDRAVNQPGNRKPFIIL